jgi:hypothetical protein
MHRLSYVDSFIMPLTFIPRHVGLPFYIYLVMLSAQTHGCLFKTLSAFKIPDAPFLAPTFPYINRAVPGRTTISLM